MAGTTTLGFPYPAAGDAVSAEAAKVQELAQFCDDQQGLIRIGSVASGVLVAGVVTTVAVTFSTPFPVGITPVVVLTLQNVLGTAVYLVDARSVTRTGFTAAFLRSTGTASMTASYVAVGQ